MPLPTSPEPRGQPVERRGSRVRQVATPVAGDVAAGIRAIAGDSFATYDLRAVLVRVVQGGEEVAMLALGESMSGVPATTGMRFRNGAVAISLVATMMLTLVEDGIIDLDEPIGPYLPGLPDGDQATFRMLANMTAGYRDHVTNPAFVEALMIDPFREFFGDDLIAYSLAQPRLFAPGENWEYSHAGYVILGQAIEAATGTPVDQLMQERVLGPLGLVETTNAYTPVIPEPALHAFSSERRTFLGVEPGKRFYEDSSFWNPSWTITRGAIQTTTITDMAVSMEAVGKGTLLSTNLHAAQVDPVLVGFGSPIDGCHTCAELTPDRAYGLGVVINGPWRLQRLGFFGYTGTAGYRKDLDLTIAVAVTYGEGAYDENGDFVHGNVSSPLFAAIDAFVTGDQATPIA